MKGKSKAYGFSSGHNKLIWTLLRKEPLPREVGEQVLVQKPSLLSAGDLPRRDVNGWLLLHQRNISRMKEYLNSRCHSVTWTAPCPGRQHLEGAAVHRMHGQATEEPFPVELETTWAPWFWWKPLLYAQSSGTTLATSSVKPHYGARFLQMRKTALASQ